MRAFARSILFRLGRIKRFAIAQAIRHCAHGWCACVRQGSARDVDLLDWLRQCRRAGLNDRGKLIYDKGVLDLAKPTDQQPIEAEDDYRICIRRSSGEDTKPKTSTPERASWERIKE
ncbi:MAG: hypothetical protein DMG14_04770 [Acidobacteria bacterium]|nr:MAG: hypothetical protein DMG14_04770 [Acidobacteriota bacterium]